MAVGGDGTARLPDGRRLGFTEWGDPGGDVVLSFHGGGTCRLFVVGGDDRAAALGVRVIGVDRPGFGLSDHQPGRTTPDWPADVAALLDAREIDRCAVIGVSAGGRYALACGAAPVLAGRVAAVGVVAGALPPEWYPGDDLVALAAADRGAAAEAARDAVAAIAADVDAAVAAAAGRPGPDGGVLSRPAVRDLFAASYREAFRNGLDGPALDLLLTNSPWGFDLADVAVPVRWWHGTRDWLTSPPDVRRALRSVPDAELTVIRGAGHSVGVDIGADVLGRLAADLRDGTG